MESNRFQDLLRKRKDALLLPWTLLTGSIGIWAIASSLLTQEHLPAELPGWVAFAFWLPALGLAAASIELPREALGTKRLRVHMSAQPNLTALATTRAPGGASALDTDLFRELSELSKSEQRLFGLTHRALRPLVLGLALSEGVALVGFVYSLVASNFFAGFPMLVLAFALNGWHFPRVERLLARGAKLQPDEDLADFDKDLRVMERELNVRPRRASRPQPKT